MDSKHLGSKNQARPVIGKGRRRAKKILYAIFFNTNGYVVQISCKDSKTITGKFYKNEVLAAVKKFYQNKCPSKGLKGIQLIHDNV